MKKSDLKYVSKLITEVVQNNFFLMCIQTK